MRRFEVSEVGPREVAQLSLVGLRALSGNDKGVRRFTPAFVWQANNRHFLHGRVPQENAFDLNGGNVFAAANDDVFQAVAYCRNKSGQRFPDAFYVSLHLAEKLRGEDSLQAC